MVLIYYSFNRSFQPFLNVMVLTAMSSLSATYVLVALPYLPPVVNFTACSFGHLNWTCRTAVFYRCTVESILIGRSAAHKTLNFSTHTNNIACWVTCWSLSLCSVQCSLWPPSPWSVQCSFWSLTLQCSVLLLVSVTLQCLVLNLVSVALQCSVLIMVTHSEVFSAPYGPGTLLLTDALLW